MLGFVIAVTAVVAVGILLAIVIRSLFPKKEPAYEPPVNIDERWLVPDEEDTCCGGCRYRPPVETFSNIEDVFSELTPEDPALLAVRQTILSNLERGFPPPTEQSDLSATLVAEESEVPVEVPVECPCEPVRAEISDTEPFLSYDLPDDTPVSEPDSNSGWGSTDTSIDDYSYSSDDGGADCGSSDCGSSDDGGW